MANALNALCIATCHTHKHNHPHTKKRMVTETGYRGQSKSRAWTRIGMNGERLLSPALRRSRKDVNALLAVLNGDSLKTINHLQQRHQHPGQRL